MIFLGSDYHLDHQNILDLCASTRSRFKSLEDMQKESIEYINKYVKSKDILYYLGDLMFYDIQRVIEWRNKIKCETIHFIEGNHDHASIEAHNKVPIWSSVSQRKVLKYNKKKIILDHYPIESWDGMYRDSIHLCGHTHGKLRYMKNRLDVGFDSINKWIISIDEAVKLAEDTARSM